MFDVAKGMKQHAQNFKEQFKKDQKVIDSLEGEQENNIDKTKKESSKLKELQSGQ